MEAGKRGKGRGGGGDGRSRERNQGVEEESKLILVGFSIALFRSCCLETCVVSEHTLSNLLGLLLGAPRVLELVIRNNSHFWLSMRTPTEKIY